MFTMADVTKKINELDDNCAGKRVLQEMLIENWAKTKQREYHALVLLARRGEATCKEVSHYIGGAEKHASEMLTKLAKLQILNNRKEKGEIGITVWSISPDIELTEKY